MPALPTLNQALDRKRVIFSMIFPITTICRHSCVYFIVFIQCVVLFLISQTCYDDIYRILKIDIMIVCINQIDSFCVRHLFIWITFAVLVRRIFFFLTINVTKLCKLPLILEYLMRVEKKLFSYIFHFSKYVIETVY